MPNINPLDNHFYHTIRELLHTARGKVYQTINTTMTQTYWEIGKRIVEEEQNGEDRAKYGKALLENLSYQLTQEFGKGFSVDNILFIQNPRQCHGNSNLAGLTISF